MASRPVVLAGLAGLAVAGALALAPTAVARSDGSGGLRGQWLAGDTHVHTDHSSDGSLPRQAYDQRLPGNLPVGDQIEQAERTGLDFLPLTDHRSYDQHWDPQWRSEALLLIPGEEANGSPHATVHGAVDTVVQGAEPPGSPGFRRLQASIWDAGAQDANWSTAHPDDGEVNADGSPNANASAVGVDTVEVWNRASDVEAEIAYAESRWNAGFRFGAVGASDNHFRELWGAFGPGSPTTWVFAAERSERAILDALKAGRTTLSSTPQGAFVALSADVDGDGGADAIGGDELTARAGQTVELRVRMQRGAGTTVRVFRSPGRSQDPVATLRPSSADETFRVSVEVPAGSSWFRAEARGPGLPSRITGVDAGDALQAFTSPIFVSTGGAVAPRPEIPVPDDEGADDGAERVVGRRGAFAGFADVAAAGRVTHVVAEVHRRGATKVVYRRLAFGRDGTQLDLAPRSRAARFPRVAASGRHVWVTWQDERAGQRPRRPDVYVRHSADAGRTWGAERRLTSGAGRAIHPAIALAGPTDPVVAWSDNRGGAFDVYAQRLDDEASPTNLSGPGKRVDPGNRYDSRSPRYPASLFPAVAAAADGRLAVAWQDNRSDPDPLWTGGTPPPLGSGAARGTDPDDWDVLTAVRSPGRASWGAPVEASTETTALADCHPDVAFDASGDLVAAWDAKELRSSGANLSVRASRSTDGGATWSGSVAVGKDPAAMSQRPRLDATERGGVRAVWYDSRSSDWRWRVLTSALDGDGGAWSPARTLSGPGNGTWPAIFADRLVFTTDRRARRVQRDPTHEVVLLEATEDGGS